MKLIFSKSASLILLCATLAFGAEAKAAANIQCRKDGKIFFEGNGAPRLFSDRGYCFDSSSGYLVNYSCHLSGSCNALRKEPMPEKFRHLNGSLTNPQFQYCILAGGKGSFVKNSELPSGTSVCKFSDGSFVGIDYLVGHLIEFVK